MLHQMPTKPGQSLQGKMIHLSSILFSTFSTEAKVFSYGISILWACLAKTASSSWAPERLLTTLNSFMTFPLWSSRQHWLVFCDESMPANSLVLLMFFMTLLPLNPTLLAGGAALRCYEHPGVCYRQEYWMYHVKVAHAPCRLRVSTLPARCGKRTVTSGQCRKED